MIDEQERDGIVALLQSPEQIQRGDSRIFVPVKSPYETGPASAATA